MTGRPEHTVQYGARLLDAKVPDWFSRVKLDTLDITDADYCVLGTVFADEEKGGETDAYSYGVDLLGLDYNKAFDYGFNADYDQKERVEAAWRNEISWRRQRGAETPTIAQEWSRNVLEKHENAGIINFTEDATAPVPSGTVSGTLIVNGKTILLPDNTSLEYLLRLATVNA